MVLKTEEKFRVRRDIDVILDPHHDQLLKALHDYRSEDY